MAHAVPRQPSRSRRVAAYVVDHIARALITIAVFAVLGGVGGYLLANDSNAEVTETTPQSAPEVRILSPEDGAVVDPDGFTLRGEVDNRREDQQLWVFVRAPVARVWYQTGGAPVVSGDATAWSQTVGSLGGCGEKQGQRFRVRANLYGPSVSDELRRRIDTMGTAPYQFERLPTPAEAFDRIRVRLSRDADC